MDVREMEMKEGELVRRHLNWAGMDSIDSPELKFEGILNHVEDLLWYNFSRRSIESSQSLLEVVNSYRHTYSKLCLCGLVRQWFHGAGFSWIPRSHSKHFPWGKLLQSYLNKHVWQVLSVAGNLSQICCFSFWKSFHNSGSRMI